MAKSIAVDTAEPQSNSMDIVKLGERIKEMRLAKGLTMEKLAGLSGVPASSISKIENGQLRPSFVHAINLATALQENLAFLVGRYRKARLGMLSPGAYSGLDPMQHRGEELCYVIHGAIRYRIDGETIDLLPREYLQFKGDIAHSWENAHSGETRVLWVFSDGLSF